MLDVTTPEVLRFLIMDKQPGKSMQLDPGKGVVNLTGEYDRRAAQDPPDRSVQLSSISGEPPCPVPFQHLVTAVQVARATLAAGAPPRRTAMRGKPRC